MIRQIYEARLIGADAILLIAAILTTDQMNRIFMILLKSIGLDALVEVHDREELERVLGAGYCNLIGINNRNLKTFVTDLRHNGRVNWT